MEITRTIRDDILMKLLVLVLLLILAMMVVNRLNSGYFTLQPEPYRPSEVDFGGLVLALEKGDIPSEEEVLMWQQLLQQLKNQIDAGIPLTQAQIGQLQRLYDLTKAYVPWLEELFELLRSIIQQITLDNAALEMELSGQGNQDSDKDE